MLPKSRSRLTKILQYSKLKKSRLSGTRPKDSGGGACRRLPMQLDAAFGEKLLGRVACLCVGPRGAPAEAHPVLLIAHGPAEQPLTALVGEARGLLPGLDQDVVALQGNPPFGQADSRRSRRRALPRKQSRATMRARGGSVMSWGQTH